eukprot:s521_g3.t1
MLRDRHEQSKYHQVAAQNAKLDREGIKICSGLNLSTETGEATAFGSGQNPRLLKLWVRSGCIAVLGSGIESLQVSLNAAGDIVVRDAQCEQHSAPGSFQIRGKDACKYCIGAANKSKSMKIIREWCVRITHVDLAHCALQSQQADQSAQAAFMKDLFPELREKSLEAVDYSTLCEKVRGMFLHIPTCKQHEALTSFVSRSVKYLTPKMLAGVSDDVKKKIATYLEKLTAGDLLEQESIAIDSWQMPTRSPVKLSMFFHSFEC